MLPKRLETVLDSKIYCSMLSQYSRDNTAQVKSLYNVDQETWATIVHEKFPLNVGLISLRQHCTGKILVECCPRDTRQNCRGKKTVQCCVKATLQK